MKIADLLPLKGFLLALIYLIVLNIDRFYVDILNISFFFVLI